MTILRHQIPTLLPYTTLFRSRITEPSLLLSAGWMRCATVVPSGPRKRHRVTSAWFSRITAQAWRSEEHTSELQSQSNIVCCLLLEINNISYCSAYNVLTFIII